MKKLFNLNNLLILLGFIAFNCKLKAQNTFRINYDIASFDLAGGVAETPAGNYLFAGTNATFIPLYGNLFEVDPTGNVVWAKSYVASISTDFSDIKKISTGGYIVSGASDPGQILMKIAAGGVLTWANRYRTNNGLNERAERVLETSDGGFITAGSVESYDPTGPPTILDSANIYIVKTNSVGTILWDKIIFVTTAFDNEHFIRDVAEVSDGYIFVGSTSEAGGADESTDALILKTDLVGNLQWIKKFGSVGNTEGLFSATTLSNGEVLVSGSYNNDMLMMRVNAAGTATWGYTYASGSILIPNVAESYNSFETVDAKYASLGTYIDMGALPTFTIGSFLTKIEPSNGNLIFQRSYNGGLSSVTPEGIQVSDSGYVLGMMAQQFTGFNYHLIKTDETGNLLDTACTPTNISLSNSAFSPSFVAITPAVYSGSTSSSFVPVVSNITPTQVIDCQTIICTPPPNPTASATNTPICSGASTTINGSGSGSGVIYSVFTTPTGGSSIGTTPLVVSPTTTTTYYVESYITATSCPSLGRDSVTITVNPLPTVTATASPNDTVCAGTTVTLTGGGATSYSWDNGVTDGVPFSPSGITTYIVTGTDGNTCQNTAQITITVISIPTVTANASPSTPICDGDTVTLTGGGATSYSWDNGVTDGVPFTPTTTNIYTVIGTTAGCSNTAQVTVTVNSLPTVTANASPNTPICSGDPVTLTGGGATSYLWDNGVTDGAVFNPTATTIYTVTGTDGNFCQNTAQVTVTVNPLPTVTANASPNTPICSGDTVTLIGGGATSYSWNNGVVDGVAFTPTSTTTYTVIGTAGGCSDSTQITITVNPLPTITAIATPDTIICVGDPVTLTGGGGISYTWDNGVTDGVGFTPTSTSTYTVSGIDGNGCSNTDQINVNVVTLPTVTATSLPSTTICQGDTITLNGGGATTYTWDNGVTDGVAFVPSGTLSYVVTGTVGASCSNTDTITVVVNPLPTVTASSTDTIICQGDQITLSGGGATSYTWDNGVTDGVIFTPSATTTYTVIGTDTSVCSNTAQLTITVNPLPTINVVGTNILCNGDSTLLTANGGSSYVWSTNDSTAVISVTPTSTTTYNVTGTDANGCNNTGQITVTVFAPPTASVAGVTDNCFGSSVNLTASGGGTYNWNTGDTSSVITVSPTDTTTYTLVATIGSCVDTTTFTVNIIPTPSIIVTPSPDTTIILGQTADLTVSGGTSFLWNPNNDLSCSTCSNPTATPEQTTTYCVSVTDNGCVDTSCVTVIVDIVCGEVYVPTAFSPNGDGSNDCLKVYNNCIESMVFRVYARWGEIVFETTDVEDCWGGSFKGKDLNNAVFIYTLNATLITGEKISLKGNVSLIR